MVEDVGAGPLQDHPFMVVNVETTWGDNNLLNTCLFHQPYILKPQSSLPLSMHVDHSSAPKKKTSPYAAQFSKMVPFSTPHKHRRRIESPPEDPPLYSTVCFTSSTSLVLAKAEKQIHGCLSSWLTEASEE